MIPSFLQVFPCISMSFSGIETFGIDCARSRTQHKTSVVLICHPLVPVGKVSFGMCAGEHTFFFFPEEVFLGTLYFYFRLGIPPSGYRNNILLADPK